MTRRRYTKAEKATAVIAAEMSTVAAAAQANGVPESTLRYWMDDPKFADLRAKTREEAATGFRVLMHAAQARLFDLIPTMEARDLTILLGVAADKGQLLSGEATSRTETRSVTDDLPDDEKRRLRDWIDSLPTAARTPGGAPG
jgi:transposase-like protein